MKVAGCVITCGLTVSHTALVLRVLVDACHMPVSAQWRLQQEYTLNQKILQNLRWCAMQHHAMPQALKHRARFKLGSQRSFLVSLSAACLMHTAVQHECCLMRIH